jgi:hypothetical protein
MSNGVLELRNGAIGTRVGQATAVEQSRAVAEVHAMVVVAQQMPRSIDRAVREMQRSCSHIAVAKKAFYRYSRGGGQVTGESITLAKELARCWGNIDYGLAELRRDDYAGESEMMAFAWDLETNTRPRTTFIVPHVRDNGSRLTSPRDIYENNANMGVRRMREQILNLMPPWFIEDAKALCYATMAADKSDGATLAERAATAVKRYAGIGVSASQLAQKLGAPQAAWSAADLAQLGVIYTSIERGETTKEDEFGATSATITVTDLAPPKNVPPAGEQPQPPSAAADRAPGEPAGGTSQPATTGQVGIVNGLLESLGMPGDENRDARVRVVSRLLRRPLTSTKQMTRDEAHDLREKLKGCAAPEDLDLLLAEAEMADDPRGDGEVPNEH